MQEKYQTAAKPHILRLSRKVFGGFCQVGAVYDSKKFFKTDPVFGGRFFIFMQTQAAAFICFFLEFARQTNFSNLAKKFADSHNLFARVPSALRATYVSFSG